MTKCCPECAKYCAQSTVSTVAKLAVGASLITLSVAIKLNWPNPYMISIGSYLIATGTGSLCMRNRCWLNYNQS